MGSNNSYREKKKEQGVATGVSECGALCFYKMRIFLADSLQLFRSKYSKLIRGQCNGYGQRGYADGATLRSVINDPRFQSNLESLRLCVLTPSGDSINEIFQFLI